MQAQDVLALAVAPVLIHAPTPLGTWSMNWHTDTPSSCRYVSSTMTAVGGGAVVGTGGHGSNCTLTGGPVKTQQVMPAHTHE